MSQYTDMNVLAQFWNRDMTRLEWAKWVYHHPEQTEELIERLLQGGGNGTISIDLEERLTTIENTDKEQSNRITALELNSMVSPEELSNADIDEITGVNPDEPPSDSGMDSLIIPMTNQDVDNITGIHLPDDPLPKSGMHSLLPMTNEDIDNITGVILNG